MFFSVCRLNNALTYVNCILHTFLQETLAIADRVMEIADAVNSNPPNFEIDLDSIEAVDELIVKLDQVII